MLREMFLEGHLMHMSVIVVVATSLEEVRDLGLSGRRFSRNMGFRI